MRLRTFWIGPAAAALAALLWLVPSPRLETARSLGPRTPTTGEQIGALSDRISELSARVSELTARLGARTDRDPPPGSVLAFAGPVVEVPEGWQRCDGRCLSPTDPAHRALFEVIGTTYGGDGEETFCVPDYRGLFLRGVDDGRLVDPEASSRLPPRPEGAAFGDHVGSMQGDAFTAHDHGVGTLRVSGRGEHVHELIRAGAIGTTFPTIGGSRDADVGAREPVFGDGGHVHGIEGRTETVGAGETRPANIYVHYLVKL